MLTQRIVVVVLVIPWAGVCAGSSRLWQSSQKKPTKWDEVKVPHEAASESPESAIHETNGTQNVSRKVRGRHLNPKRITLALASSL